MLKRLQSKGITTTRQLCALSRQQMNDSWESVLGDQWWHWLRGREYPRTETRRRSVSHSHVLGPKFRTDEGARSVLVRLIHKAAARLRRLGFWAKRMKFGLRYTHGWPAWDAPAYLGLCQDTQSMLRAFEDAWSQRPTGGVPLKVSVWLWDLVDRNNAPLPLFVEDQRNTRAAEAMDAINELVGPNSVYFASMHDARQQAPMRIAFTHIPDVVAESETAQG